MGCILLSAIYLPMNAQEPNNGDGMAMDIQVCEVMQNERVTNRINGPALVEDRHLEIRQKRSRGLTKTSLSAIQYVPCY